ncbi:TauD/TfdA dioxygenase family protein [Streptomyces rhizosphaericus]|uniref:Taurine dioxygenase n=1 Tax=Streptomyces rhizosphaericus TaxID=114699 RepID=A0A6G4AIS2_9ACTN|nr:TauD/TfdA family dioxygenase [Streptomyces rhizosphaericus]NEW72704.1 taurine dioxygenase [Streptomyces rhizosphaericus]
MTTYGDVQVNRLADALGAEVTDVDWSNGVDAETVAELRQAWLEHHVLVFRHQRLSPDRLRIFGQAFGELEQVKTYGGLDGYPEIMPLIKEPSDQLNVGEGWHIDSTYRRCPPAGAALYAIDVPPKGGDTLFSNMYLAYNNLSAGMRRLVDGLHVVHANGYLGDAAARNERQAQQSMKLRSEVKTETARHPLVRTHPETKRKSLYVNKLLADGGMIANLLDMSAEESAPLVRYLCEHAARDEFTWRVKWEPGMLVLYDNRCLQHNAPNDYSGFRREMWRLSLAGDVPF